MTGQCYTTWRLHLFFSRRLHAAARIGSSGSGSAGPPRRRAPTRMLIARGTDRLQEVSRESGEIANNRVLMTQRPELIASSTSAAATDESIDSRLHKAPWSCSMCEARYAPTLRKRSGPETTEDSSDRALA